MIVCLEHPTLPEFSCCGRAFDDDESEEGPPVISDDTRCVNCAECIRTIRAFRAISLAGERAT